LKYSKFLALPALLLGLCGAITCAAETPTALPSVAFEKFTLPNGLDVILVENHKLPIVAVNVWYHVGAANEAPGLTGFAHLFEHMMFAASKHVPRGLADKLLEGAGVTDSNGSTDFDRTNYFDTVPANQIELALWVHSDRMGYLLDVLDQTALSNQQDVVRNERRQNIENQPYGIVEEALYHQLFPKTHPYHGDVMGSHADIQAAKLDDIRGFFKTYYRPNNASLVIVGDIDKTRTKALVAKYFGSFKRGPDLPKLAVVTPPITSERRAVIADRVELPRVFMGWLTPPIYQAGDAELDMTAQILGGGKSSRLYKTLVYDKQIAQDVSASQNSNALTSVFVIDVTARAGHSAQEIEAAIDTELQTLRNQGPTEKELERARNTIETGMLLKIEQVGGSGLANQLNQYNQYVGDPGYLAQDIERHRRLSSADVQRVVASQLQNNNRVVVYGIPGTQDLGPEVATPTAPKKIAGAKTIPIALNVEERWRRQAPKAGPVKLVTLPKGDAFKLANGLTVIHHYNPALPMVAAELVIKSGSEANPLGRSGLASFTAQMLEQGTQTRSALQIADEVAQLGAFLGAGSSADASSVEVMSLKSNFSQALALLADVAQNPAFPAQEIERQRSSLLGELSQQRDSAEALASRAALAALYGDQHPYGFSALGTESSIKSIQRAELAAFWQQHYVPNNAALIVAGDITRDELAALVQASFGDWRRGTVDTPGAAVVHTTKARLLLIDKPGAPQTALRVTSLGPDRKTPLFESLQVLNAALGGLFTSRLNTILREQKGYTYAVGSGFAYRRLPGPFAIATSVRTEVTAAAVKDIFAQVRDMGAKPMQAWELSKARNSLVLSLPGQFETNKSVDASLANIFVYDLGLDYYSGLAARYASATTGQVQSAAKTYLQPDRLIVVGVGDQKKIAAQLSRLNLGPIEFRDSDAQVLK
jgi:zinc protease